MKLSAIEQAKSDEIKQNLTHLIGERIYDGWTFIGANIIASKEAKYYNFPNLALNITLSHDLYSGGGENSEVGMVRNVLDAIMVGYSLEEAQERRNEIEDELQEGYVADGITPLYNLRDMRYVINADRYNYTD